MLFRDRREFPNDRPDLGQLTPRLTWFLAVPQQLDQVRADARIRCEIEVAMGVRALPLEDDDVESVEWRQVTLQLHRVPPSSAALRHGCAQATPAARPPALSLTAG